MLRALSIRDVLIIDRLDLGFQPGLNVLTGETGAGKSILLDALGFVLGWRGRAELVRSGAAQGEVTAEFDLPAGHAARSVLAEAGLEAEDELILRRINYADGRKTAFVNDRRVSGEVLRDLSDTLVELHGQHDDRGLLNPRGHRSLLDSFAGIDLQPCGASCPQECLAAGAANSRECQAVQVARLTQLRAAPDSLRILGGDFNANPQSFVYQLLVEDNGWSDAYAAAGFRTVSNRMAHIAGKGSRVARLVSDGDDSLMVLALRGSDWPATAALDLRGPVF